MASKKITEFELASAVGSSFVPVSNSSGTVTNKVTLQSIANLVQPDSRWNLFLPPAPTNLSGVAGDSQVSLTWSSPSVISVAPITDYVIQYSANSGTSWTTYSDSISSVSSGTITGLTNGTNYTFRVVAINGIGTGVYSTASSTLSPVAPTTTTTTTTTTTAAPLGSYSLSGAGNSGYNGCYTEAGTHNGKPYYTLTGNGATKYIAYSDNWSLGGCAWYIANQLVVNDDYLATYIYQGCEPSTPPTGNSWTFGPGPNDPAPTVSQGCGG